MTGNNKPEHESIVMKHERDIEQIQEELRRVDSQFEYAFRMTAELNKVTHGNKTTLTDM